MKRAGWPESELAILREHYPTKGGAFVAAMLGRELKDVQRTASRKKIKCGWSDEQVALLRELYPTKGGAYVGELVGRSARVVVQKALTLGIKCKATTRNGRVFKPKPPGPSRAVAALRRGPAYLPGEVDTLPRSVGFKFTACPTPPPALRTNTFSVY